jgi:uncharacterized protein YraI
MSVRSPLKAALLNRAAPLAITLGLIGTATLASCGATSGQPNTRSEPTREPIAITGLKCGRRLLITASGTYHVSKGQIVQARLIEQEGLQFFHESMLGFPWGQVTATPVGVLDPIKACYEGFSSLADRIYNFRAAKHGTVHLAAPLTPNWQQVARDAHAPSPFAATVIVR